MKGYIGGILERILAHMRYTSTREQALALELTHVKEQLGVTTTRYEAAMAVAEERLALLTAASALADERVALIAAAATRADAAVAHAESIQQQLELERKEHGPASNRMVRLELRVQALKRRCERLQAELCKSEDQLARADVSGRTRELQEEVAQLKQRVADLQTYFAFEPFTAARLPEGKQDSVNPR